MRPGYDSRWWAKLLPAFLVLQGGLSQTAGAQDGANLDLSSTERSMRADAAGNFQSVSLNVEGGGTRIIDSPSAMVTPAEFIAITQVLSGTQNLVLNSAGAAVGGHFETTGLNPGSLLVPTGVAAVHNFAIDSQLNIAGALTNSGALYLVSNSFNVTNGIVSASTILNSTAGLISSIVPSNFANAAQFMPSVGYTLQSAGDLINLGTIASAGSLNLQAAGAIVNGDSASISAMQNLSMLTNIGAIVNSGLISSVNGNVNIASSIAATDMVLNNIGGVISAAGSINIRDNLFSTLANTTVLGGDLLAKDLNIFSGEGAIQVDVNKLIGVVNVYGKEAHISAATEVLTLGNICLSGDPTFYNKSGDVVINTSLVFSGAPLAIVASRNILTAPGAGVISTASGTLNAGDITLIAGAEFDTNGPGAVLLPGPGDTASTLTVYGASVTGGKIDLTSTEVTTFDSRSTALNGSGGDITLIAFAGMGVDAGTIKLPTMLTLQSGGNGNGSNGNVTILAGSPCSACALSVGAIDTTGGAAGTGNVTVATASPVVSNVFISNGNMLGTFSAGAIQTASIMTGNIVAAGSVVTLTSGGSLATGDISNSPAGVFDGGTVSLNSNGATAFALGDGGTNGTGEVLVRGGSLAGKGGSLSVVVGKNGLTIDASEIDVSPASGTGHGGSLSFTSEGTLFIDGPLNADGFASGDGGVIQINLNSASAFVVGAGAATNGILGQLTAKGGVAAGKGGTVSLNNTGTGGIKLAGTISAAALNGIGGLVAVKAAAGTISNAGALIDASGGGAGAASGGSITLNALSLSGTGFTTLLANAAGSGDGGTVTVQSTGASDILIDDAVGGFIVSATGGSIGSLSGKGGTVSITSSRHLTVDASNLDVSALGTNGGGGKLSLSGSWSSAGNLFITGDLNVDGKGEGDGGSISLTSYNNANPFRVENGATIHGVTGKLSANAGSTAGGGGDIYIYQASGYINLDPNRISANASAGGGDGGDIHLSCDFGLVIHNGTIAVDGTGNGKGGSIQFYGPLSLTGNLTLSADGAGTGDGGDVWLSSQSTTFAINVGFGAPSGQLRVSASGGSAGSTAGNGGSIFISNYNDIIVDPNYLDVRALGKNGNGGTIYLDAGENMWSWPGPAFQIYPGRVLVTGTLDVSGVGVGNGGTVNLYSNRAAPLNIEVGEAFNGVSGSIIANGGLLGGNGGKITLNNARERAFGTTVRLGTAGSISASASLAGGNGGHIDIGGSLVSNVEIPSGTIDVSGRVNGDGGSIHIAFWNLYGGALTLLANGAGDGNGGEIWLRSIGDDGITIGAGGHTISATGGSPGSAAGDGGYFSITAGNQLTVDPTAIQLGPQGLNGSGGVLSLGAGSGCLSCTTPIYRPANLFINGSINMDGIGKGNGGAIYLGSSSMTAFTVGAGAAVNGVNGTLSAKAGLTAGDGGEISIFNSRTSSAGVSGGVTILAAAALNVNASPGGGNGGYMDFESWGAPLTLDAGVYSVDAAGPGDWNGGEFGYVSADSLVVTQNNGTGPVIFSANAAGNGDGGEIYMNGFSTLTVGSGAGEIMFSAHGGSAGSTSGDGGYMYWENMDNVTIDGKAVTLNPLGANGWGGSMEIDGANVTLNGSLNLTGKGTGDGGELYLYAGSTRTVVINGDVFANGGSAGYGGGVDLESWGSGNVTLNGNVYLDGGKGGGWAYLGTSSGTGTTTLGSGALISASGIGTGASHGGSIEFWGPNVVVAGGGSATLRADASGSGNGGEIYIETDSSGITVGGSNGFMMQVRGGSVGSASGNGGVIELYSANNLTVDTTFLQVGPQGINGNGGEIYLQSALSGAGNLSLNGTLCVDGAGSGNGGSATLVYRSASPFVVGGTVTANGISGSITADAPGTGIGGTIEISNDNGPLLVALGGVLSAGARNKNNLGSLILDNPGRVVDVSGTGSLTGNITARGSSVNINVGGPNSILQVSNITASAGAVNLLATGIGSSIFLPTTSSLISATGDVQVAAPAFASYGKIGTTSGDIQLVTDSINFSCCGSIDAGNRQVVIAPLSNTPITVGSAVDIDGMNISAAELSKITASLLTIGSTGKTGNVSLNGNIDLSAASGSGAYNLVFNNGGTYVGTGHSIDLGNHTLDITALGGGFTGQVEGTNTSITITTSGQFNVNQAVNAGAGGTVVIQSAAGSNAGINLGADIGGGTNTTVRADGSGAITWTAGTVSGTNVVLSSGTGSIGTLAGAVVTNADNLAVFTGGVADVNISEQDNVTLNASSAGRHLTISAGGSIQTIGDIAAGTGAPGGTLQLTAAGDLTVSSKLSAANQIFLTTTGTGLVDIAAGASGSAGWSITVQSDDVNLLGTLSAPVAVAFRANGDKAMAIADDADGDGDDATFDLSLSEMGRVTSAALYAGYQYSGGGITLAGDVDVSGAGTGNYNLSLWNRDNIDTSAYEIQLGNRRLDIQADMGTAAVGAVSGGARVDVLGGQVQINGPIIVNATGTVNITSETWSSFNGNVVLNDSVGGGSSTIVYASGAGTLTQSAGSVSGTAVDLSSDTGSIGTSTKAISTSAASNLTATTGGTGSVFLDQASAVNLLPSSAGDHFELSVAGDFTYTATNTVTADSITLVTASGSDGDINVNANMSAPTSIILNADGSGSIGGSGTITTASLQLTSGTGDIGSPGQPLNTISPLVQVSTAGDVYLSSTGTVSLANSSAGAVFNLASTGAVLRSAGTISAGSIAISSNGNIGASASQLLTVAASIRLTGNSTNSFFVTNTGDLTLDITTAATQAVVSTSGALTLASDISASDARLTANNDFSSGGHSIAAPTLSITSTSGNIGGAANRVQATTGNLTLVAGGSAYATMSGAITLNASTLGGTLDLAAPSLTTAGNISAGGITLGTASITNNFTVTATSDISVDSGATAFVLSGTGTMAGTNLNFTTTSTATLAQSNFNGILNGTANGFSTTASAGNVTAGIIDSGTGALSLTASGVASLTNSGSLRADRSVTLNGRAGVNVGNTASIVAGVLAPGFGGSATILPAGSVLSSGGVTINNYQGGAGSGDVVLGNDVFIQSAGGTSGAGDVGIVGSTDIMIGTDLNMVAYGGDVWMSAGDDLLIGTGARISSYAKLDDAGGIRNIPAGGGSTVADYSGGRIALYAGVPGTNMSAMLNGMVDSRTATGWTSWPTAPVYDPSANSAGIANGGAISIILAAGGIKNTLTGNSFIADGGVLAIDPPDPNNVVAIGGAAILALGPALIPGAVLAPQPVLAPAAAPVAVVINNAGTSKAEVATIAPKIDNQPSVPTDRINQSVAISSYTESPGTKTCQPFVNLPQVSAEGDDYTVVSQACQGVALKKDDNSYAFGVAGSTMKSNTDGSVSLSRGKMLVMAGDKEITIKTGKGEAILPTGSAAILETTDAGVVRIASLAGEPTTFVMNGKEVIVIKNGEESVVASVDNREEELIPIDGVERMEINAKIVVGRNVIARNKVNQSQLLHTIPAFDCDFGCFHLPARKKLDSLRQASTPGNQRQTSQKPAPDALLSPVSYVWPLAPRASSTLELATGAIDVMYMAGTSISVADKSMVRLRQGEALIRTREKAVILLGTHHVDVKANSTVFIKKEGEGVRVINLGDHAANSVMLRLQAKQTVAVSPGNQVVSHENERSLHEMLDSSAPIRRTRLSKQNGFVASSEVSLTSLFLEYPVLQELSVSKDKSRRAIMHDLQKFIVSLQLATQSHGGYGKR